MYVPALSTDLPVLSDRQAGLPGHVQVNSECWFLAKAKKPLTLRCLLLLKPKYSLRRTLVWKIACIVHINDAVRVTLF